MVEDKAKVTESKQELPYQGKWNRESYEIQQALKVLRSHKGEMNSQEMNVVR